MGPELVAEFEKQFFDGPPIQVRLRRPVDHFSLTVLFGPSGSGKTTTLRCLAGLDRPDEGSIDFGGEAWFGPRCWVRPQRREIGYLAQDYALFPHLSAADNIAYGLSGTSSASRRQRVGELLDLL